MITINSGATNSITLRLSDNVVGDTPIYLFEFESVQSGETFYCTPANTSTTTKYNTFLIREITDTGLTASLTASMPLIELDYGGYFNYRIYEASDYSMATTSNILDYGKMLFINGEYQSFFFDVNYEYGVFDEYDERYIFIADEPITRKVFDEYDTYSTLTYEESILYAVFDEEFIYRILTTEADEDLNTEEGYTILW